jgi:ankyrin repeat protein
MERSYRGAGDVLALLQDTVPYLGTELHDIDQPGLFGDTPLIQVMTWNDVGAATLLLDAGADIAAKGEDGNTALHAAASFGYAELVILLLARGAPVSAENDKGCTPAETAKEFENDGIAALLGSSSS